MGSTGYGYRPGRGNRRLATLVLIAGTLAGCQDQGLPPVASLQPGDSADQILFGVSTLLAPDGIRRNRLEADTAYVYDAPGTYDLRDLTLVFYDENGVETSVLTADSGVYRVHTGAMEAHGDVVVRSPGGKVLRTPVLRYDRDRDELSTDEKFTYDTERESIEGNGFRSDPQFRHIVTSQPRGGQRGESPGSMLLPGQQEPPDSSSPDLAPKAALDSTRILP